MPQEQQQMPQEQQQMPQEQQQQVPEQQQPGPGEPQPPVQPTQPQPPMQPQPPQQQQPPQLCPDGTYPPCQPQPPEVPATSVETDSTFATSAFERVWAQAGTVQKSIWLWGQGAISDGMYEPYLEGKDGVRLVQYFDKSRMEINNLEAPASEQVVTSGRLVVEMIEGKVQIGDNSFETLAPSEQTIAGDPAAVNPFAPTYSSFRSVSYPVNAIPAPNRVGQTVTDIIAHEGTVTQDSAMATYGVTIGSYSEVLGHNIPQVFTDFFTQQGMDVQFVMGLPVSEPYWATVMVGGVEKDILIQAFERRVITYTPDNAPAWQVEMGNVGQHYMNWRYPATDVAIR